MTLYSGRNSTFSRPRTDGSASITAATLLIRWMIVLAKWYADHLGVSSTPTFFINGRRVGGLAPPVFERVIEIELKRAR